MTKLEEHIEDVRREIELFDAKGAQLFLAEVESGVADCEKRAKDHEMNAREFRQMFKAMRGRRKWREVYNDIERAIDWNEKDAGEYRELVKRGRDTAENIKLMLAQHAAVYQTINGRADQ